MELNYLREPLGEYFERISSKTPVPGGGSVSACIGALSSSLLNMVLNYTIGKKKYAEYEEEFARIRKRNGEILKDMTEFIVKDSEIYEKIKETKDKEEENQKYLKESANIHLKIIEFADEIIDFVEFTARYGNKYLLSDTGMSAVLSVALFQSSKLNLLINLKYIEDKTFVENCKRKMREVEEKVISKGKEIYREIIEKMEG